MILTPDEQLRRVRACVVEAGFDASGVLLHRDDNGGKGYLLTAGIPRHVAWKAMWIVVGQVPICWPCFRDTVDTFNLRGCDHDKSLVIP